jgi:ornithine carbamoyltransferase
MLMKRDMLDIADVKTMELLHLLDLSDKLKKKPAEYSQKLKGKTLLMLFEKPSLRTRVSFEVGMTQLGGHAIYYDISTSPMGKKETVEDTAKTASRYVDIIMARLFSHEHIVSMAKNSTVPVINALTDYAHPCQTLADLQTIREKKRKLKGLKIAYLGDGNNNVTHSLMQGCAMCGMQIAVGCPPGKDFMPDAAIVRKTHEIAAKNVAQLLVTNDAKAAIKDADVVYTDSWMSYHIPDDQKGARIQALAPYQVTKELMAHAKKDAIFMHCLPAQRGMEMTSCVIDGKWSVVFDQAENRLHTEKALMLWLLGKAR